LAAHFLAAQAAHFLAAQGLHFLPLHAPAAVAQRTRQAPPAQPASAAAVTTAVAKVRERSRAKELISISSWGRVMGRGR
jgi:hypothetical protein